MAIIIDEYDKPIVDYIEDVDKANANRNILRSFFGVFKGNTVNDRLHFLFITGISKFSEVSLFSVVNNLTDITYDPEYAKIVGYTEDDLNR